MMFFNTNTEQFSVNVKFCIMRNHIKVNHTKYAKISNSKNYEMLKLGYINCEQ
jgi:hypothetical protein